MLFRDRPLIVFLVCAVMFNFWRRRSAAAVGRDAGQGASNATTICVVTTHGGTKIIEFRLWPRRHAGTWGRKPLLLIAFGVLPVRAVLYTLTHNPGVDRDPDPGWRGGGNIRRCLGPGDRRPHARHGRFNLTLGAIGTAVGMGASLSQLIAGSIVHRFGSSAGFLFLAAVAAAAFGILYFRMPETRDNRSLSPTL
jgi:hypothetical protein